MQVFMGSFAALILLGTGLLLLPGAHPAARDISILEAFFTATSATCVTGLTVVDTGAGWTRFGQVVIIGLVQVGGLGMMTFAAFFGLAYGRGMGVRDAAAMGEMLNLDVMGRVGRATAWIIGATLVIEAVGAAMLYGHWVDDAGRALPGGEQLYYSVFHSISAFCNAGFSLHSDSMVRYVGDWPIVLSISGLVIMGGLGFLVIMELATFRYWAHPSLRRFSFIRRRVKNQQIPHLSIQTRIVLVATLGLLIVGALGFLSFEWNYTLRGLDADDRVAAAIFQSMASRTAGFNSVDTAASHTSTQFWTVLLMLVGGSPGSVAGGIKTTTFVVLILSVMAAFRGRPVEVFRRRIPDRLIHKSLVMLVLALSFIAAATLALSITEAADIAAGRFAFEQILFEAASAFCTVGLSAGVTGELTGPGQLIIIACMYLGRIGPLALVLALGSRAPQRFAYPEEPVMIG
jgi:trk system potassium uptake protein TrkH